jgi:YMGG-like Gly-zipper
MNKLGPFAALAAALALASGGMAVAAQQPSRSNDQQVEDLLSRIDERTDTFRSSFDRAIDRNPINGTRAEEQINQSVKDFAEATDRLRDRVNDRRAGTADVEEVLNRALLIGDFMMRNPLDAQAESDWNALRGDLDQLARVYGVTESWTFSGNTTARVDDKEVEQLLKRIEQGADQFRKSLDKALDDSAIDDSTAEDNINHFVTEFAESTDHLSDHFGRNQVITNDIEDVLRRGVSIDGFMQRHRLDEQAENDWVTLRRDLDNLARAYHVAWNWSDPRYRPQEPGTGLYHRLTGTYRLESNRGDNPREAAENAARAVPAERRERAYQGLMDRLESPDVIAIDRNEDRVSMASSLAPRVSFEADGRVRTERESDGSTIETRAAFYGDQLVVATTGNRGNDFKVTFEPMDDGRTLRLTRHIYDAELSRPVTVQSFYQRSSDAAQWDLYTGMQGYPSDTSPAGQALVPNGTRLVATLNDALSAENAREGDRFTLTIQSPSQYQDAVIGGLVTGVNVSGRLSGRSDLSLAFQTIRLRNGSNQDFGGVIENVRTPDGETIAVNDQGRVEQDSRTEETLQRGAIGAAIGAVIGAITGGKKGAAIGAVIGAGGGAGTVILQGRDRLDLPRGTELTIISGAPGSWRTTSDLRR